MDINLAKALKEKLPCQRLRWGKNRCKGALEDTLAAISNITYTFLMSIVIISIYDIFNSRAIRPDQKNNSVLWWKKIKRC